MDPKGHETCPHTTAPAEALRYTPPVPTLGQRLKAWWKGVKDSRRTKISEEQGVQAAWYKKARDIKTPAELQQFVSMLTEDYAHDYGTICHAVAAASLAAAHTVNHSDQGGITGFQSGAIMWEFIAHWQHVKPGTPMRLVNFEEMLYPQCEDKFKTLSKSTWEWLQAEARKRLLDKSEYPTWHPDVKAHIESIAKGAVPFGYAISDN